MKPLLFFSVSLLIIPLLSCQEKTPDIQTSTPSETRKIYVERSSLFDNYSDQKLQVADFVELYFNLMYDSTLEDRNALWDSKILTHQQDFFLKGNFEKGFFSNTPRRF